MDGFDGRSLRPLLADATEREESSRRVFSCIGLGWPMVRAGTYKYFMHAKRQVPVLFDLGSDPGERVNLADDPDYAPVTRELSEALAQRVATATSSPLAGDPSGRPPIR